MVKHLSQINSWISYPIGSGLRCGKNSLICLIFWVCVCVCEGDYPHACRQDNTNRNNCVSLSAHKALGGSVGLEEELSLLYVELLLAKVSRATPVCLGATRLKVDLHTERSIFWQGFVVATLQLFEISNLS